MYIYLIIILLLCYILYKRQKRIYKYVYYTDINVSLIFCNKINIFIISLPIISNLFYIILIHILMKIIDIKI